MENKRRDLKVQVIQRIAQTNEESIVQAMSQVSLRDLEIIGIKNQNKNLEDATLKKEEGKKVLENKCKYSWIKMIS